MKSKTFCSLPWDTLDTIPDGTLAPCCYFDVHKRIEVSKNSSIEDYVNSAILKSVKEKMLGGEKPNECTFCYKREEAGGISPRTKLSDKATYEQIVKNEKVVFKNLHLRNSNICDLKCRSCGPFCSTAWNSDYLNLYPEKSAMIFNIAKNYKNIFMEIKNLIPHLNHLYLSGGEPLLDKSLDKVLELYSSNTNEDKYLHIQTNLSNDKLISSTIGEKVKNIKNCNILISIDGVGREAEFIRKGKVWDAFDKRLNNLLRSKGYFNIIFTMTISVYNVFHILDVFKYLEGFREVREFRIELSFVERPYALNAINLTNELKIKLASAYDEFLKSSPRFSIYKGFLEEILNYVNSEKDKSLTEFYIYTKKLDRIRNENTFKLFPYLR